MSLRLAMLSLFLLSVACGGPQQPSRATVSPPSPAAPGVTGAASPPAAVDQAVAASPATAPGPAITASPGQAVAASPPSTPAVGATTDAPHRLQRVAEMWAFRPDGVTYDYAGCVEVLKPGQEAIAFGNSPIWKGDRATSARWVGDMELLMLDPVPYPGNDAYQVLMHVTRPKNPAQVGERLRVRYTLDFDRVPYLHQGKGDSRLLSLTLEPLEGIQRHNLLFAVPQNAKPVQPQDLAPTQVMEIPGWRVFRYEISKTVRAVVHLSFDLTAPTGPLPALEELLPQAEAASCP